MSRRPAGGSPADEVVSTSGVRALAVTVRTARGDVIVDAVDLDLPTGTVVGLVGESGSGKTSLGLAMLGYSRTGTTIAGGSVLVGGTDLLQLDDRALQRRRSTSVSYVAQDPGTAFNPARRLGRQLWEVFAQHSPTTSRDAAGARVREVLAEVGLPTTYEFLRRFPHQLSGGQLQRVSIAMAFLLRPALVVMDEPTTGLDVVTQSLILDAVGSLCQQHRSSVLYISHDLAVVSRVTDRTAVMYAGRVVEQGPTAQVITQPRHPYTRRMIMAAPDPGRAVHIRGIPGRSPRPGERPQGCAFFDRCDSAEDACATTIPALRQLTEVREVACLLPTARPVEIVERDDVQFVPPSGQPVLTVENLVASHGMNQVLHGIDFELNAGECLALVGESGSGKSTLSRSLAGLHDDWAGEIRLHGAAVPVGAHRRDAEARRQLAYIFQNPYAALNPRKTIGQIVAQPVITLGLANDRSGVSAAVNAALESVELDPDLVHRYPGALSGGQRQRVAIARALAAKPSILLCDEVTSALDVAVQAAVVNLLGQLRESLGLAMLFVTHDFALVRSVATRVAVLSDGRLVEVNDTKTVFDAPQHDYTRHLISSTPSLEHVRRTQFGGVDAGSPTTSS
ncbi:ABC transporter ATP-binding protein [Nocardioides sp.]|uniref:ABC transporter ATP-binding protein n=1 Tax=Nocardioides sp. TaxID=35761 RepID=UPI003D152FA5